MSIGKLYRLAWLKQSLPKPIKSILEAGKAPRLMQTSSLPGRARRLFAIMRTQDRRLVPGLSNSFTFEPRVLLSRELRSQLPASVVTEVEPIFDEIERSIPDVAYRIHAGLMRVIVQDDSVRVLDRLGAAASIEIMTPFVDSDVIDLLATVPSAMRLEGRNGDNLLRALMRGRLPDALLDRQKQAFFTPMADWLRGPLRSVLEDYARPERVAIEGIFEPQALTRLVNDHLSGRRDQHVPLRYFLMFELWRERWKIGT
jgi:hypothetical protein